MIIVEQEEKEFAKYSKWFDEVDVEYADIPSDSGSAASDTEEDNNDIESQYVVNLPSTEDIDLPIILADDETVFFDVPVINSVDEVLPEPQSPTPNSPPPNSPSPEEDSDSSESEFEDENIPLAKRAHEGGNQIQSFCLIIFVYMST